MTTIFPDINDEIYIVKCLTYNPTTKSYEIDTEKKDTWEKATFFCPPESTNFPFIEGIFKKSHPTKNVSKYQTI